MSDQMQFDEAWFSRLTSEHEENRRLLLDVIHGLEEKAKAVQAELETKRRYLEYLDRVLGIREAPPRDKDILKTVVSILPNINDWDFRRIIVEVEKVHPRAKQQSVRSALQRLVQRGNLTVRIDGAVKRWTWTSKPYDGKGDTNGAPPVGSREEMLIRVILDAVTSKRRLTDVDIATICQDMAVDALVIDTVISQLMSTGRVELVEEGDKTILVLPGSDESLKRVRVSNVKRLFPGTELPPHL